MKMIPAKSLSIWSGWLVFGAVTAATATATESSESSRPPPATNRIGFEHDIRPIFETTCFRCHGPQNPKSHFSLVSRESALAGGDENTNDIVPGDSAQSLLIHYVARQVPDMEMPPDGRGEPLTSQQIGLLRAWIDQGAVWNATNPSPTMNLTVAPTLRWIEVDGNKGKFREQQGTPDGFSEGLEQVSFVDQLHPDEGVSVEGHAIMPAQDIDVRLAWNKTASGFVHAGFEQWRTYYNDAGGYDPDVQPRGFFFDSDLHVDHGRAWVDLGLDLPRWPLIVLGYEYQYQRGNESTLAWGFANGKNIYPATQSVDEQTHIIKLDVSKSFDDWSVENHARVEFYSANNTGYEGFVVSGTNPDFIATQDKYQHVQGMDTLNVEKQIFDWWRVDGGFYYSRLSGSDYFNQTTIPLSGNSLSSQKITLNRESEIFSVASLFTPLEYLNLSLGTQNAWTQENGFSASIPNLELGGTVPANSSLNEFQASQSATAQFTKIPATVVFGDLRFNEDNYSIYQAEDPNEFQYETVANNFRYVLTPGLTVSPWSWCEATAQYTWRSSSTDYEPNKDVWPVFTGPTYGPTNGYPGFILDRTIRSDQLKTKLVLRPANWLKTTFSYQLGSTQYSSKTDPAYGFDIAANQFVSLPGGPITDGHYDLQTFGIGATLTPARRWYFSSAFTYSQSSAVTADNGNTSVVPYEGNIFTLTTLAHYAINMKTGVQVAYNYSHAGYGQNNAADGIPTGLDYTRQDVIAGLTRKLTQRLSAALHYEFVQYSEPSSSDANNFTANGVFLTLIYQWP